MEAIDALMEQGAKGLIFDVRFNPGGYTTELVKILDYLLPEGPLFRRESYDGQTSVDYSDAQCVDLPMAVLANESSYSAAEFFAAALQEYDAAVVVGEQTTGKGYYQNTFRLVDGSAVAISTGKYFTPKGESLAGVGVMPDVPVKLDQESSDALDQGILEREKDLQLQRQLLHWRRLPKVAARYVSQRGGPRRRPRRLVYESVLQVGQRAGLVVDCVRFHK